MMRLLRILVMAFLLAPAFAGAEVSLLGDHDSNQPVDISADSLEVLQADRKAMFTGNVVAKQGSITLKADTMTVHYRSGEKKQGASTVSRIEVLGDVLLTTPEESARGKKGVYDVDNKKIHLLGEVVLMRQKNVLKGQNLVYDFVTGQSIITGDKSGGVGAAGEGRVRGLFLPNSMKKQ